MPLVKGRLALVPEVIQSSAMDCGPAALTSYVGGHGIEVSYGRLREACQTDVDGTAIETLEDLANALGTPVEQVLLPRDAALFEEARSLPAIAVVRLPNGNTHFAVVWSLFGGIAQVMDPASGRRWVPRRRLLDDLHEHVMTVPAADWRKWAASDGGLALLRRRLDALGVSGQTRGRLESDALADPGFHSLAALEASARLVQSLVDSREARRGSEAESLLAAVFEAARADRSAVPASFWSVRPEEGSEDEVVVRGAVLLRPCREEGEPSQALPRAVAAARDEKPVRPARELWGWVRRDGLFAPVALAFAALASAAAVVLEALLFRLFLENRAILLPLLAFLLAAFVLDASSITGELRLGRRLERGLRLAFQKKIPRLADRYFSSRLTSDMAERLHAVQALRKLPRLSGRILRRWSELLFTAGAILWLAPSTAPLVVAAVVAALAVPWLGQPLLYERDGRVRSHVGGLSRFYLDSLLGLAPLRVHGAQKAVRSEHEGLLRSWAEARRSLQRVTIGLEGLTFALGYGLVVLLVFSYLRSGGDSSRVLLLAYWALNLPVLGLELTKLAWRTPESRNVFLRVTEPLRAPEEGDVAPPAEPPSAGARECEAPGMSIRFEGVSVRASGHPLLQGVHLDVAPGSHVAVVGPSGAGKTSLFATLLGFHFPEEGRVLIDGSLLSGGRLAGVRSQIAWIDPSVQIWNESLSRNLLYGNEERERERERDVERVLDEAALRPLVASLPRGVETKLGEGGALVSGGEGQRVRFGRALLRGGVRLALLDEPFRGLDRPTRVALLRRAREHFRDVTLLAVTHDLGETGEFDRVLVLEGGRLVEDGHPRELLERDGSRYRRLLETEAELQSLWADGFRSFRIENGRLVETSS
jgi:ATP-binding cassette subfamily B protein